MNLLLKFCEVNAYSIDSIDLFRKKTIVPFTSKFKEVSGTKNIRRLVHTGYWKLV